MSILKTLTDRKIAQEEENLRNTENGAGKTPG
jgi:hypothetical protein